MNEPEFVPQDPRFREKVAASFAKQKFMETLGASISEIEPGSVKIEMAFHERATQQHGFLHAAAVAAIADSACGYAALTLMPAGVAVLSVEYKINLLSPAVGDTFFAVGKVKKAGRRLTYSTADVIAQTDSGQKLVATLVATIMTITDREIVD